MTFAIYKDKTVCVTGHTGFKGSWLVEWLLILGAKVVGYALDPPTEPSHFSQIDLGPRLADDIRADVRDVEGIRRMLREHRPDFIFHLAAQPIVRLSYAQPLETMATNVMGTANVIEAVRREQRRCVVVVVTTDKVYENHETPQAYRETDRLGGHDLYSASKGCAEMVISSYRRSFFRECIVTGKEPVIAVASARAGNVVGGGDWGKDRLVPDCVRSLERGEAIPVRNKTSTRPWQHVLEPLSGYLRLGAEIFRELSSASAEGGSRADALCSAFNFGPHSASHKTVLDLVTEILRHWPGEWQDQSDPDAPHEAGQLNLATDKALDLLEWRPQWDFQRTIEQTVVWYRSVIEAGDTGARHVAAELTQEQINSYAATLPY